MIRLVQYFLVVILAVLLASCEGEISNNSLSTSDTNSGAGGSVTASGTAQSGSYSQMTIYNGFMYAIDNQDLLTFEVISGGKTNLLNKQEVGFNIETILVFDGHLLIGSNTGMFVYEITPNGVPARKSKFDYSLLQLDVTPCDPIVANKDVAYSTLYTSVTSEGPCSRTVSIQRLVAINITNLSNPTLIRQYNVLTPRGLGVLDNLLFLCNDSNGLTVMDISDPKNIQEVSRLDGFTAYDIIVKQTSILVIGDKEIRQYDITDPESLKLISVYTLPLA